MTRHIHVEAINRVALSASPELLQEWFPDGKALERAFRAGGDGGRRHLAMVGVADG